MDRYKSFYCDDWLFLSVVYHMTLISIYYLYVYIFHLLIKTRGAYHRTLRFIEK